MVVCFAVVARAIEHGDEVAASSGRGVDVFFDALAYIVGRDEAGGEVATAVLEALDWTARSVFCLK